MAPRATIDPEFGAFGSKRDLAPCLDRCDVLSDEPRDIRRMGRDHEMTGAGNGHQRRSGDRVSQHLGDAEGLDDRVSLVMPRR